MILEPLEKVISVKIVYFGPAMSGKTTSLKAVFNHFGKDEDVLSIENTVRRTLFFDYGIIEFQNTNWLLKLHVYSTTGQDFYLITRPITMKALDGIIFVVDSQRSAYKRNIISWRELVTYFGEAFIKLPKVIAFNKQDLQDKFEVDQFLDEIEYKKYKNISVRETIALNGEGILSSFEDILRLIFTGVYNTTVVSALSH